MKTRSQVALAAATIIAGAGPAFAVDQIIVTAQRREEQLQDVPLAVSAFDAASIENRQIDVVKDIGQNVPNLQTYTVTAGAQAIQVHSRGASIQNPGFNLSESPVGIYQDDVYFGRMASANLDLSDIERIEVLRGPQGTLYGRNTIAGAIKVISRTPGDETWANGSVGVGNYETFKVSGSVGGPIEEGALAGSLSFVYDDRNQGWQDNPITGDEPGEYENLVMRGKLHWYQGDVFDAVLSAWGASLENDGYNGVPQTPFFGSGPNPSFDPAPPNSEPIGGFYSNLSPSGVNYGESDQAGANLTLSWDLGSFTIKSITGYMSIDDDFGFDLAGGGFFDVPGAGGLLINSSSEFDQWSEELQLLGTAMDDRLNYLVGVFYLNEDGSQNFDGNLDSAGFGNFNEQIENETDSYAVFAEGTYQLTDAFSITAGARWTKDEKEYSDSCSDTVPGDPPFVLQCQPGPGNSSFVALDDDWDEVTGKLGLDYKLDEQTLVYLTWAQGFQSGGFRTLCFGNLTASCGGTPFDPQTVDSFELGYKADLLDNTLRFNADVFYAMYDDIQQIVTNNAGGFPIANIGEVDVYGVELEILWAPSENLNIYANAGYQESDFGSVDPNSPPGGLGDACSATNPQPCVNPTDELPSNPQFQGKIGFDYTVPVSDLVELFYGADVFYSDDYFSEARNQVEIDSYHRVNGFIGIGAPDQAWQVVLTGRNITDEEDYVSGIFANGFTNIRTALPPAEYMLTFKVNY